MTRRALLQTAALVPFIGVTGDTPLTAMKIPIPLRPHEELTTIVEGFWHSGNSFLHGNVLDQSAVIFHRHDVAAFAWGRSHNLKLFALVRNPLSVVASLVNRGEAAPDEALDLWCAYYRHCLAQKDVRLLSFDRLTKDYHGFMAEFESLSGLRMNPEPDFANQHAWKGERLAFALNNEKLREATEIYGHCV